MNRWWDGQEWTPYTQDPVQMEMLALQRRATRDRRRAWNWVTFVATLAVFALLVVGLDRAVNH